MAEFNVTCQLCGVVVWEGDAPHPDPQAELSAFADTQCPVGGAAGGCPNVTPAVEEAASKRPEVLRDLIAAARARLPRTRRLVVPALTANTPQQVTVSWPTPLPDDTYCVTVGLVALAGLLGRVEVTVHPDLITPEGCVLIVASPQNVAANTAGLHVVATP